MNQIIIAIIILAVLYYLDKYYNPNKKIGDIGESIVANRLALLPRDYMIYNNIHCGFYQIDHLVIRPSSRDIFVIETKKWGGKITGKYDDKRWMQYKDGKVAFYKNHPSIVANILKQNAVLIQAEDWRKQPDDINRAVDIYAFLYNLKDKEF